MSYLRKIFNTILIAFYSVFIFTFVSIFSSLPTFAIDLSQIKMSYRFTNGIFFQTNTLKVQGPPAIGYLSPDISFFYFVTPTHAIGGGSDLFFNYQLGTIPLYSIRTNYRWYFYGTGHPKYYDNGHLAVAQMSGLALYAGSSIKRYEYFLGGHNSDNPADPSSYTAYEQRGNFFNVDMCGGIDYRISHNTELNVEFNMTALALSASDDRIRMANILFLFGIARWW